jgi:hypothetical protein
VGHGLPALKYLSRYLYRGDENKARSRRGLYRAGGAAHAAKGVSQSMRLPVSTRQRQAVATTLAMASTVLGSVNYSTPTTAVSVQAVPGTDVDCWIQSAAATSWIARYEQKPTIHLPGGTSSPPLNNATKAHPPWGEGFARRQQSVPTNIGTTPHILRLFICYRESRTGRACSTIG